VIAGNTATEGGGGTTSSWLERCTVSGNSAKGAGGSYYGTLINCLIAGNSAGDPSGARIGDGGGAFFANLTNCTLRNNSARMSGGGAIWSTLVNCLVADNSALQGGGTSAGLLINCTVVGNFASSDGQLGGGRRRCPLRHGLQFHRAQQSPIGPTRTITIAAPSSPIPVRIQSRLVEGTSKPTHPSWTTPRQLPLRGITLPQRRRPTAL
jgi:hypothetical protein